MAVNPKVVVTTPAGYIRTVTTNSGSVRAEIVWNQGFGSDRTRKFTLAQKFIDNEVLRCSERYTPKRTGVLIASGILGTEIGSGEVRYTAPYARRLYYNPQYRFNGAPERGAYWFERMKAVHKEAIMRGAGRLAGQ